MQQHPLSQGDKQDAKGVIQRIKLLAMKARENSDLVIYIQHNGTVQEGLEAGSTGWQIINALAPQVNDIVIEKTTNDAFYKTPLNHTLQERGITDLIFCGWATDFCVDTSLKMAISRDYKVSVAADCHTLSNRGQLSAAQLIKYYNALWGDMLSPMQKVNVTQAALLYRK